MQGKYCPFYFFSGPIISPNYLVAMQSLDQRLISSSILLEIWVDILLQKELCDFQNPIIVSRSFLFACVEKIPKKK